MKWILLSFILGCVLVSCTSCMTSQKVKIVTDITPDGQVTYHTEYIGEF